MGKSEALVGCCCCCVVILILLIIWLAKEIEKAELLNMIEENLTSPPISDIQFGYGVSCPAGFQDMDFGTWPGTSSGCFCPITNTLTIGACSSQNTFFPEQFQLKSNPNSANGDIRYKTALHYEKNKVGGIFTPAEAAEHQMFYDAYGCHTVQSTSVHQLQVWKGRRLCVSHYAADEYYWTTYPCKTDFKRCQSGLCVKSTLQCPVTKIEINDYNNSANEVYLYLERDTSKRGLFKFQLTTQGEAPCLANNRESKMTEYPYYPLLRRNSSGCGSYGIDNSSILVDSELEADLYIENGLGYTVSTLPQYTNYLGNRTVSLYARQRLDINTENENCLAIDLHKLHKAMNGEKQEQEYLNKIFEWNCFLDPAINQIIKDLSGLAMA